MPTYQYACTDCGESLEAVQSFSDPSLTECPACGGQLRKVFSAVGVVFKGSGFYKTDSRSSSSATTPATSGSGEKKSETSTPAPAKTESSSSTSSSTSGSSSTTTTPAA
ncbi:MAG: regulatory protein FmdB family [Frankiales bacterium]|nr:regulatory protein FmdB family [Frankiales bacterium]